MCPAPRHISGQAILLVLCCLFAQSATAGNIVHTFKDEDKRKVLFFNDSVRVALDPGGNRRVEQMIQWRDSIFRPADSLGELPEPPFYSWATLTLVNNSSRAKSEYFRLLTYIDSIWMYEVQDGRVINTAMAGSRMHPFSRELPWGINDLLFSIDPGERKDFYFRMLFRKEPPHISKVKGVYIVPRAPDKQRVLNEFIWQSFYAGIMLLFLLVSLFMFLVFRERIFIYYGLLTMFFGMYFPLMNGVAEPYIFLNADFGTLEIGPFVVTGIVLLLFLFMSRYISLGQHFPKLYKWSLAITLLVALSYHIGRLAGGSQQLVSHYQNILLLGWILLLIVPVILLMLRGDRSARVLFISICILLFGSLFFVLNLLGVFSNLLLAQRGFQAGSILFSGVLFFGLFTKINSIRNEKDLNEKLLINILPSEVAEELKIQGRVTARNYQNVSVLFTDFISFTTVSEQLKAEELVAEINHCFEAFDHIVDKYGIEKIKTIGDSYMAAGGLPVHSAGTEKRTIQAALEMQQFLTARKAERESEQKRAFSMRVGIHTGPIVAGVVGIKKFQYDLWGDTVNTASRIESMSAEGKVNISQQTWEKVKDEPDLKFESRGEMEVKGKGMIRMYFVSAV